MNSIINPLLRQALFDFGATTIAGFKPTIDDVRKLNAALANLGPDATAGNIDEKIQSLNSFGFASNGPAGDFIQNHPRSAEILEEIKRLAVIKAKFTEFTPSSAAASPVSMHLMTALPQEKQTELLADEGKKLKKLLGAGSEHDFRAAAREADLTNESFRDAGFKIGDNPLEQMAEEQKAHRLYRTIHNAKIAEILGGAAVDKDGKSLLLDKDQIERLNHFLITQRDQASLGFVDSLIAAIVLKPDQLELNDKLQAQYVAIHAEHKKNIPILTALAAAAPPAIQKRELCKVLARIEKIGDVLVYDNTDIAPLLNAIDTAADYDAFEKALAALPLVAIVAKLKNWESIITPETFQYLKQQKIKQNLGNSDQQIRTDELKKQQKEFEALNADLKKFSKANSQISDELERLSKLNAFDWLAPEIGGIAIRRAQEVKNQFEFIAEKCDAICAGLEGMRQKLQTLLDGMPTGNDEHPEGVFTRNRVKSLRKDIESKIDDINTMLNKYQDVHFRIYGDPLIPLVKTNNQDTMLKTHKQGVLPVIQEAAAPQAPAAEQPANCHGFQRQELKAATRAESIKTVLANYEAHPNAGNVEIEGNVGVNGGLFADLGAVAPGQEVFYAKNAVKNTNGDKVVSASGYTETRGKPVTTEAPKGGKQQHQQINLKVAQWPKADPKAPDTDNAKKLLKEAKCKFAVDMTVRLLAGLGALPSPKNQIVLRGSDPEQLSMLWTALMELGDAHPDYKFDASCIRVESMHFNPKDHKKGILGYGKNSAYKQYFDTNDNPLALMKTEIKQFYERGFAKGGSERAVKNRQDTSSLFKKLLNDSKTAEGVEAVTQHKPPKPE